MPLRPTSGGHHCCLNPGAEGVGSPGWLGAVPVRSPRKSPRDPRRRSGAAAEEIKRHNVQLEAVDVINSFPWWELAWVARRRGALKSACRVGLLEIVDNVHNFPGQAHRWLADEGVGARRRGSTSRALEFPGRSTSTRGWVTPLGWGLLSG